MSGPEFSISKPAPGVVVARLAGPGIRGLGAVRLRELTRHIDRDAYEAALAASVMQARRRVIAILDWMGRSRPAARAFGNLSWPPRNTTAEIAKGVPCAPSR